jgi:serine/threonine-protein kinase RsbW
MKKRTQKYKLKIPSITENLQLIREFIIKVAEKAGFDQERQEQIALAVDEACTNVIKHAHKFDARRLIDIQILVDAQKISITITDRGRGFNAAKLKDPDLQKYARESRHGGLGIYLIKTLMDEVQFDFDPGVKNQVLLTKYLHTNST